jgi:hypothetical protein
MKKLWCWWFGHNLILMPYEDGPKDWSYENYKCAHCGREWRQLVAFRIG